MDWDEAVADAISTAQAFVLLFCSEADQSRHVKREIHLADHAKIPVYPVRLERIEPRKLGYFLTAAQWIDWLDERDSTLDRLIKVLESASPLAWLDHGTDITPAARQAPGPAWPRLLAAFKSEGPAAECAARLVFEGARRFPDHSVVLPTGRTATLLFRAMVRAAGDYGPDPFAGSVILNDTETFGVYKKHPTSRTRHVRQALLDRLAKAGLAPEPSQVHLLSGLIGKTDPITETSRVLRDFPPGVHVVSISPAGEVLGYDVGTYSNDETIVHDGCRIIEISQSGKLYIDGDQPSRSIVTIGLGSCLGARLLVLPVFTPDKARILNQLVSFETTAGVPATLLRRHSTAIICTTERIIDEALLTDSAEFYADPRACLAEIELRKDIF
jgi:6-phosphogluconolactonase/glucosamine-6-phosphate isomerase/deaminase